MNHSVLVELCHMMKQMVFWQTYYCPITSSQTMRLWNPSRCLRKPRISTKHRPRDAKDVRKSVFRYDVSSASENIKSTMCIPIKIYNEVQWYARICIKYVYQIVPSACRCWRFKKMKQLKEEMAKRIVFEMQKQRGFEVEDASTIEHMVVEMPMKWHEKIHAQLNE